MENILVTGATGNVGRQVVSQLLATDVRVRAMARRPESADCRAKPKSCAATSLSLLPSTDAWKVLMRCSWCGVPLQQLLLQAWRGSLRTLGGSSSSRI